MIKVEVAFNEDVMQINGFYIEFDNDDVDYPFDVCKDGVLIESFNWIENAIRYCMEN